MLKHSNTENSVLFPKQEKDNTLQNSLKAVRNGLAFVMIRYGQSHTVEVIVKELAHNSFEPTASEKCILHCFHICSFHHGWEKNLVILRRNKNGQKERTDSVLFKIHSTAVRLKYYSKIALKNKSWNYSKEISVEFQYDWRNLHSLQEWEEGILLLWISGRNMIICLTTVCSIPQPVNFPKSKVFPNVSVLLEHGLAWCLEWN